MPKKLTIAIPAYNNEKTIADAVRSAQVQLYPDKRVIVFDDDSSDRTREIARKLGAEVFKSEKNLGIGKNLERIFSSVNSNYILFLCADDILADEHVAGDIIQIFHEKQKVGVIDRTYYQFQDGKPQKPIMTVRNDNLFISACNPSGMAFRKIPEKIEGTNQIFIEMPSIVKQYLSAGWEWTRMPYDTIAVRIHPGGNTGTKESYYKASPVEVWSDFLGKDFKYHLGLIQIKNRAPKLLWREIRNTIRINKECLREPFFWFCATVSVLTPRFLLTRLSDFYRVHISSRKCRIIQRGMA